MAHHRRENVYCRGCGIQGASLQIIHHYLWDELPIEDVPFQCRECNARFHRRRAAVWHMETEHRYRKPIAEAFTGTLRDLPKYQMVENHMRRQWTQPRPRNRRRFRRPQRLQQERNQHEPISGENSLKPPEGPPHSEGLVELPAEAQERYDEIMQGAEQQSRNTSSSMAGHDVSRQSASESEDEDSTTGYKQEESDSESESEDSTSWKRLRRHSQAAGEQKAAEGETSMANVTSPAGPSDRNTEPDDQASDAVKDVIPVLQNLTKQLGKATQEWADLNKVYQELTTVLREHIRVMEKNNEYHHYRLLLDRGKHHGAAHMLSQSPLTQTTEGTANLQRVNAGRTTNTEVLI